MAENTWALNDTPYTLEPTFANPAPVMQWGWWGFIGTAEGSAFLQSFNVTPSVITFTSVAPAPLGITEDTPSEIIFSSVGVTRRGWKNVAPSSLLFSSVPCFSYGSEDVLPSVIVFGNVALSQLGYTNDTPSILSFVTVALGQFAYSDDSPNSIFWITLVPSPLAYSNDSPDEITFSSVVPATQGIEDVTPSTIFWTAVALTSQVVALVVPSVISWVTVAPGSQGIEDTTPGEIDWVTVPPSQFFPPLPPTPKKKTHKGSGGGWHPRWIDEKFEPDEVTRNLAYEFGDDRYTPGEPVDFSRFAFHAYDNVYTDSPMSQALAGIEASRRVIDRERLIRIAKYTAIGGAVIYVSYRVVRLITVKL